MDWLVLELWMSRCSGAKDGARAACEGSLSLGSFSGRAVVMLNGRVKVVVGRMVVVVRIKRWMKRGADILDSLQVFHSIQDSSYTGEEESGEETRG